MTQPHRTSMTATPAPILNPVLFSTSRRLSESDVETKGLFMNYEFDSALLIFLYVTQHH